MFLESLILCNTALVAGCELSAKELQIWPEATHNKHASKCILLDQVTSSGKMSLLEAKQHGAEETGRLAI